MIPDDLTNNQSKGSLPISIGEEDDTEPEAIAEPTGDNPPVYPGEYLFCEGNDLKIILASRVLSLKDIADICLNLKSKWETKHNKSNKGNGYVG